MFIELKNDELIINTDLIYGIELEKECIIITYWDWELKGDFNEWYHYKDEKRAREVYQELISFFNGDFLFKQSLNEINLDDIKNRKIIAKNENAIFRINENAIFSMPKE